MAVISVLCLSKMILVDGWNDQEMSARRLNSASAWLLLEISDQNGVHADDTALLHNIAYGT